MTIHTEGAAAARAVAGLPAREFHQAAQEQTLPQAGARRLSMDEVQLHDLTYHAATTYLYQISGMTKSRAQLHAIRIANAAVVHALASDYLDVGEDHRG